MELDSGIIYAFAADLLKEDLGRGDLTTQTVVRGGAKARGRFAANQDFVLCGLEIAEAVFATLDNSIVLESRVYDGEKITVSLIKNGPGWQVDGIKSNAPVGP